MPFTPFHMGAALLLKPVLRARFSVLVFGVSQVAIDIEPLVRMLRGDAVLHGWTHTLLGAVIVGTAAALVARAPVNWWLGWFGNHAEHGRAPMPVTWSVALLSAWIGTGSHLVFDGIMHGDLAPFAPITRGNPLLRVIPIGTLHLGLLVAGLIGLVLLALREEPRASGPPDQDWR